MSEPSKKMLGRSERGKTQERMLYLPIGFHVLLALKEGPATGAELSGRIIRHTLGRYIGGTSFYEEIRRLERAGLVSRSGERWSIEIRITEKGERVLKFAAAETKRVLDVAQRLKLC